LRITGNDTTIVRTGFKVPSKTEKEVIEMKEPFVFLLPLLFFAMISISGSGSNAFAAGSSESPVPADVAILTCSTVCPTKVTAFTAGASVTAVTIKVGDDCAGDLELLFKAGLGIRNVQTNSTGLVYTLAKAGL
jgi:hypothetical protein